MKNNYPTGAEALFIALNTPNPKGSIGIPVLLWGKPGVGKSSLLETLQSDRLKGLTFIASIHDPTDFSGLPVHHEDKVEYAVPEWVDTLENIAAQCPEEGGRAVLAASTLLKALTGSNLELVGCSEERAGNIQKVPASIGFSLYPNPSSGMATATYQLAEGQSGELSVWDVFGRQVAKFPLETNTGTVQIDNLSTGIYFISLSTNGKVIGTANLVKH